MILTKIKQHYQNFSTSWNVVGVYVEFKDKKA